MWYCCPRIAVPMQFRFLFCVPCYLFELYVVLVPFFFTDGSLGLRTRNTKGKKSRKRNSKEGGGGVAVLIDPSRWRTERWTDAYSITPPLSFSREFTLCSRRRRHFAAPSAGSEEACNREREMLVYLLGGWPHSDAKRRKAEAPRLPDEGEESPKFSPQPVFEWVCKS